MLNKDFNKNLIRKIKQANRVFIIGHNYLDLDALGACVGMAAFCHDYNVKTIIIIPNKKNEVEILTMAKKNARAFLSVTELKEKKQL